MIKYKFTTHLHSGYVWTADVEEGRFDVKNGYYRIDITKGKFNDGTEIKNVIYRIPIESTVLEEYY